MVEIMDIYIQLCLMINWFFNFKSYLRKNTVCPSYKGQYLSQTINVLRFPCKVSFFLRF